MKHFILLSTVASIALLGSFAQAQPITWGPATDVGIVVGNSSDVSLNGTLVEAANLVAPDVFDDPATVTVTVNSVVFPPVTGLHSPNNNNSGPGSDLSIASNDGDPEYDAILSTVNFGGGTDATTITVGTTGGLIVGNDYEIQVWFVDDRPPQDARVTPVSDANGNTVNLNDQFSIGSFTATGTSLVLTIESPGFGQAHLNAYQIRDVTGGDVLKGDIDLSGVVDFADIPPFIAVLQSNDFQAEADTNCDEVVNFGDIVTFIAILQAG